MAKSKKTATYSVFRYQLVPMTVIQSKMFGRYDSYDDLIARKNEFFFDVATTASFAGRTYTVIAKIEYVNNHDIVLRMGVPKNKEIHLSDFKTLKITDHPNIYVYIDNQPDRQYIFIEHNLEAFSDTKTVVNILSNAFSRRLQEFDLTIYIEQTFNESEFWDTIREYQGIGIKALKFEFIKPNLANISRTAVEQIQMLKNGMNSHKTELEFKAPAFGELENLTPDNAQIEALVKYNKEGGGATPKIKAKGIRKYIKTIKSEKTITIEEVEGDANQVIKLIKELIQ